MRRKEALFVKELLGDGPTHSMRNRAIMLTNKSKSRWLNQEFSSNISNLLNSSRTNQKLLVIMPSMLKGFREFEKISH